MSRSFLMDHDYHENPNNNNNIRGFPMGFTDHDYLNYDGVRTDHNYFHRGDSAEPESSTSHTGSDCNYISRDDFVEAESDLESPTDGVRLQTENSDMKDGGRNSVSNEAAFTKETEDETSSYTDSESEILSEGGNDEMASGTLLPGRNPLSFVEFGEKVVVDVAPRFGLTGEAFYFRFVDTDQITDTEAVARSAFQHILNEAKRDAAPSDYIGVSISHPTLDKEALVHFRTPSNVSVDEILGVIETIQMSKKELDFDETMNVKVTRIHPPAGEGRYVKMNTPDWYKWYHKYTRGHGSNFIEIKNKDKLCLARSIVVAKARIEKETNKKVKWKNISKGEMYGYKEQYNLAIELTRRAGLENHNTACGPSEFEKFQKVLVNDGYQLKIFSKSHFNGRVFDDEHYGLKYLHILHHDNHFTPMKNPCPITGTKFYCDYCNRGYDKIELHKCKSICPCCKKSDRCIKESWVRCDPCNRRFFSKQCYEQHLAEQVKDITDESGAKRRKVTKQSVCALLKRCQICSKTVRTCNMVAEKHNCGENYCKFCKIWHKEQDRHECYIQPLDGEYFERDETELLPEEQEDDPDSIDALVREHEDEDGVTDEDRSNHFKQGSGGRWKSKSKTAKFIFFDFETTQNTVYEEGKLGPVYLHKPNCCIARKACEKCKDFWLKKCQNCSNRDCETCRLEIPYCSVCREHKKVFVGPNCKKKFCEWLLQEDHKGSVALAHNAKGFDAHFILQYLAEIPYMPKIIPRGLEILCIVAFDIKIIDSLSFLPMGLASLPKAFAETEMKKGYFPYLFSPEEGLNYAGQWPDAMYYDPAHMKPEKRTAFYDWYRQQTAKTFNMKEEILAYCGSDCDILLRCCLKFRELFISETSVDPLSVSITIASACNYVFRKKYLKPKTIGLIPYGGYRRKDKHSTVAIQWLKWISKSQNIKIQHARNGGEKKVGPYKLDGFDGQSGYEFYGCVYHGCVKCQKKRKRKVPGSELTMDDVYQRTLDRADFIRAEGVNLVEKWECQFYDEFKRNKEMRQFIEELDIPEPLDPRRAFAGGRCNGTKLYHKCKNGEKVSYIDICSLYPWVCKYGIFPTKHPEIITENFAHITRDYQPYLGLIHCKVLAPRKLLHPVLPYHCGGRLMFPLCRKCAEAESKQSCACSNEERAMRGTWVSLELDKALQLGYTVEKVYEVWHYENCEVYNGIDEETGLFTKYINCFLKLKTQASGWPSHVKTEVDREQFIQDYKAKEGIQLEPSKMEKNAGLRSIAKLMLNSFWGKFGQRCNMNQVEFISEPSQFFDLVWDESNIVSQVRSFGKNNVIVSYRKTDDFADILPNTNVVMAAFTTAQARLKLYAYLEQLQERVMYYDTDSVIYLTKETDTDQPSLGSYLGDMTNELEEFGQEAYIVEFVTGGPKNYAYKVRKMDGRTITKIKVKGFALNYEASAHINFKRLKQQVMLFVKAGHYDEVTVIQPQLRRTPKHDIVTMLQKKVNKVTYKKRIVKKNFETIPYGY